MNVRRDTRDRDTAVVLAPSEVAAVHRVEMARDAIDTDSYRVMLAAAMRCDDGCGCRGTGTR